MRRSDRAMPQDWAWQLIEDGEYGVLSLATEEGPYGIPISYVVRDTSIYFHSAASGRKITALGFCQKASFVVTGRTAPVFTGNFSTYFESAMVHGSLHTVNDPDTKRIVLRLLAAKYLPDHLEHVEQAITHSLSRTLVLCLEPETVSGKAKLPEDGSWQERRCLWTRS